MERRVIIRCKRRLINGEVWSCGRKTVQHIVLKSINDKYLTTPDKDFLDGLKAALIARDTAERVENNVKPYRQYIERSLRYDTSRLNFKLVLTQYIFKLMIYWMFYTR
jgi:hypothetical protein